MPRFEEVKSAFQSSDVQIVDRNGELLHSLRADKSVRRGRWVALADISPALRTAMVLSEDKRFYEHSGVDWRAVSSAAWGNVWNTKTRGASTITMQLAGLLDEDLKTATGSRSVLQKVGQTVSAQLLERSWRKDQILEAYLNNVPFRGEMVGIDALSRTLFGKAAHGLDDREAAVTAALVRAPNARPAAVAQRACGVLKVMQPTVKTDCVGLDLYVDAALQRKEFDASSGIAPHVARKVLTVRPELVEGSLDLKKASTGSARTDGVKTELARTITTTLRAPLQRFAVQTLDRHLRELQSRHVEDGAIVVLDNATGAVLAWVGSSGELGRSGEVDFVTALRQPGSTLKPFLYAQAIAERRLTAASLLEDSPTHIQTAGGLYIPQNYDRQFKGWVSVRTALGSSLNVPAVRTLVMVSPDAFAKQLKTLGLPLKEAGDFYGYSLALGSAEVSLLNLTNAYRSLANGGRASPTYITVPTPLTVRPEFVEGAVGLKASTGSARTVVVQSVQAIDPRAAFIVSDILSDTNARARTFGSDSVLATRFWSAVKTGTSKDMRDNWAVGYSQRYTVGVWVGNASGAAMWDVSGTTGAAPVWAAVMQFLHQNQASKAPPAPANIVQVQAQFSQNGSSAVEAARQEWFLAGTEQSQFAINKIAAQAVNTPDISINNARITSPVSGTIIALDPDIPPNRQRVSFQAEGQGVAWLIDGKPFAKGANAKWLPWPGRHVVQLVDAKGVKLDEIKLEVRGAGVRSKL